MEFNPASIRVASQSCQAGVLAENKVHRHVRDPSTGILVARAHQPRMALCAPARSGRRAERGAFNTATLARPRSGFIYQSEPLGVGAGRGQPCSALAAACEGARGVVSWRAPLPLHIVAGLTCATRTRSDLRTFRRARPMSARPLSDALRFTGFPGGPRYLLTLLTDSLKSLTRTRSDFRTFRRFICARPMPPSRNL